MSGSEGINLVRHQATFTFHAAHHLVLLKCSVCLLQVQQQYKMPSLYLLDSIVKNVGGDYLHLVAQIMEETFTCVFEKVCRNHVLQFKEAVF